MNIQSKFALLFFSLFGSAALAAPDAHAILKESDQARGGGLPGIVWEIRLQSRDGERKDEPQRILVKAVDDSSVAETQEPIRFKGSKILQVERNMWMTARPVQAHSHFAAPAHERAGFQRRHRRHQLRGRLRCRDERYGNLGGETLLRAESHREAQAHHLRQDPLLGVGQARGWRQGRVLFGERQAAQDGPASITATPSSTTGRAFPSSAK